MALKSNTAQRNKYKPPDKRANKDIEGKEITWTSLRAFFRSQRLRKSLGLFFILFAVFLLLAFVSYLLSWKADDTFLDGKAFNWALLRDSSTEVSNIMGRAGAILAHLFIKQWFGVASLLFVLLFFISGVRMLTGFRLLPLWKTIRYSLFLILWLSVSLAFIIREGPMLITAGTFGYEASLWLNGLLGLAGTAILLFLALGIFIILVFDPNFHGLALFMRHSLGGVFRKGSPRPADEEDEAVSGQTMKEPEQDPPSEIATDENDDPPPSISEEAGVRIIDEGGKTQGEESTGHLPGGQDSEQREKDDPEFEIEIANGKLSGSDYREIDDPFPGDTQKNKAAAELGDYDPTLDLPRYRLPDLDLLDDRGSGSIQVNKEELEGNKNRIIDTLKNYAIDIDKIKATVGPTVTLYEIVPAPGVRISKIKNLENDIALSLAALGIRIIAPIPGRGTIGIEVPNSNPEIVSMKSILGSERFRHSAFELPIGLGKTIANETFIADLTKMPHLLMAGATGQGKSVGLNAILTSILYKKHPAYVKFVLVDPKKVELNLFSKIERHYLAKLPDAEEAIVTETRQVVRTINSLCVEMDNRYDLLKDAQARNIKEYNAKFVARKLSPVHGHRFLPYIVLFIDEFADLIMTAGKEIELPIARLAQLARAVGLHLVIATQRPSVNIITGTIKANFPARVAFRVTAKVDSRTILDSGGADQLIGRGDMLLSTGSDLLRLQCAFIDTPEIERITEFIGSQRAYPDAFHLPEYFEDDDSMAEALDPTERDELFEDAARIVVATQQGSTSLIQRKLKLGYNRAGRIIDQLEAAGIVGPFEGSKARDVKIRDEMSLEQILRQEKA